MFGNNYGYVVQKNRMTFACINRLIMNKMFFLLPLPCTRKQSTVICNLSWYQKIRLKNENDEKKKAKNAGTLFILKDKLISYDLQ